MTAKQSREQAAIHEAATLSRIAMKLQRAPANQIARLLKKADECLNRYRLHKVHLSEKPSGTISNEVAEGLKAPMQALADVIRDTVKPYGFALLVFGLDEIEGGRMNYVANANRNDICTVMREFIAAHEERLFDGPETKQ